MAAYVLTYSYCNCKYNSLSLLLHRLYDTCTKSTAIAKIEQECLHLKLMFIVVCLSECLHTTVLYTTISAAVVPL